MTGRYKIRTALKDYLHAPSHLSIIDQPLLAHLTYKARDATSQISAYKGSSPGSAPSSIV